jgi:trans-aconitate methyltransferase
MLWNTKEYIAGTGTNRQMVMAFLDGLAFKGDEKTLDIGCGDGSLTAWLATNKTPRGHVLGIDILPEMIDIARKSHESPQLSFVVADALEFPMSDHAPFDLVVSFFTLHWLQWHLQRTLFQRVRDSLSPGGSLVALMPAQDVQKPNAHVVAVMDTAAGEEWQGILPPRPRWSYDKGFPDTKNMAPTPEAYQQIVREAGMSPVCIEKLATESRFASKADFLAFVKTVTPHVRELPTADLKDRFLEQFYVRFLQIQPIVGSEIVLHTTPLVLVARA